MKLIYANIFLNGIGSALFHYLLQWGWNLIDQYTMIVAVASGLYVVYDDWFFRNIGTRWSERSYNTFSSILNALTSAALSGALAVSAEPLYETFFSIIFGVLALLLIPPIAADINYLRRVSRRPKYYKVSTKMALRIRTYLILGLIIALISTAMWVIPETVCMDVVRSEYYLFWTHGVWHVGMAYALTTVSQCIVFIHLIESPPKARNMIEERIVRTHFNDKCVNKCCCGGLSSIFFTIFLIVQPHEHSFNEEMVLVNQGVQLNSKQIDITGALKVAGGVRKSSGIDPDEVKKQGKKSARKKDKSEDKSEDKSKEKSKSDEEKSKDKSLDKSKSEDKSKEKSKSDEKKGKKKDTEKKVRKDKKKDTDKDRSPLILDSDEDSDISKK